MLWAGLCLTPVFSPHLSLEDRPMYSENNDSQHVLLLHLQHLQLQCVPLFALTVILNHMESQPHPTGWVHCGHCGFRR